MITTEAAHAMGAKGAEPTKAERLLFEAWMRGHCWALSATWNGKEYLGEAEQDGGFSPHAVQTRRIWAAWRDRAALAQVERDEFLPFLKDGESPIERLKREIGDVSALMKLYAKVVAERDALETHNTMLRVCLKGVIKVADRKTDEFDAARAALGDQP